MRPGMEDRYDEVIAFLFGETTNEVGKFKIEGMLRKLLLHVTRVLYNFCRHIRSIVF